MNREEISEVDQLLAEMEKLTPNAQEAAIWIVNHFDLAKRICIGSTLTKEEIQKQIEAAITKKDYLMAALLVLCRELQRE